MRVYDLSHTISAETPVYPGTEQPQIIQAATLAQDFYNEKKITLYSHTGTHVDAPAHLLSGARTLDQFAPEHFMGEAVIVKLQHREAREIAVKELNNYERLL